MLTFVGEAVKVKWHVLIEPVLEIMVKNYIIIQKYSISLFYGVLKLEEQNEALKLIWLFKM